MVKSINSVIEPEWSQVEVLLSELSKKNVGFILLVADNRGTVKTLANIDTVSRVRLLLESVASLVEDSFGATSKDTKGGSGK